MRQIRPMQITGFALLLSLIAVPAARAETGTVKGVITLAQKLEKKISPDAILYIYARPAGQKHGPPLAVKRITQPFHFPIEFTLSARDAMIPDLKLGGQVDVVARIAQTGSATPVRAGDIEPKTPPHAVKVGSSMPVRIELNQEHR
jgi:cytochrome c-type biogenesis protein CcmH